MFRSGRSVVESFDDDEHLYQRFEPCHFIDGRVLNEAFRFPKQSANRSQFSKPFWVLISEEGKFDECGVLSYTPRDLPTNLRSGVGETYRFFPKHVPEDANYSHSEIWHEPFPDRKPSSKVKKEYRISLSLRANVLLVPGEEAAG